MSVTKIPIYKDFDYNDYVGYAVFDDDFLKNNKSLDWLCTLGYKVSDSGKELICLGVISDDEYAGTS